MKTDSKLFRVVFASPWFLLIFLVIPLLVVLSVSLHVRLPFASTKNPLLINNACFSMLVALRFLYYFSGIKKAIRYGSGHGAPRESIEVAQPAGAVRNFLANAGYSFDPTAHYAEKRDSGYLGTVILYVGLFLVLFTGTLDNMRQFAGTLLHGVGRSTDLNKIEDYRAVITGPFTTQPTTLPKMKIVRQFMPDATYPRGATEVAFLAADGKEHVTILKSPDPFRSGAYDIYMSKMIYEPWITITIDGTRPVFNGQIQMGPIEKTKDGYGFYAPFTGRDFLHGEVYYQPEKSRLRIVMNQADRPLLDTEMIFQVDLQKKLGNMTVVCERMGVWSEIHVVRRRHFSIIWMGAIISLIGLTMRVAIRPQRIWLEETPEGCRVKAVGSETKKVLKGI